MNQQLDLAEMDRLRAEIARLTEEMDRLREENHRMRKELYKLLALKRLLAEIINTHMAEVAVNPLQKLDGLLDGHVSDDEFARMVDELS